MNNLTQRLILAPLFMIPSMVVADDDDGYEQPIQEVFQSELVFPQEQGEVQLTLSPEFSKGSEAKVTVAPLTIELGLTDNWQVEASFELYKHHNPNVTMLEEDEIRAIGSHSNSGFGDIEVGTKYSFMNINGSNYHAAIGAEVLFPTGDIEKRLTEGFREYEGYVIFAKDFPKCNYAQIFAQFGIGIVDRAKNPKMTPPEYDEDGELEEPEQLDLEPAANELFANVGAYFPTNLLTYTVEFNYVNSRWHKKGDDNSLYLTPGIVMSLRDNFEFGLGVPIGLTKRADDYKVIGKLTYEFDLI